MKCALVSLTALLFVVGCDADEPKVGAVALVVATTSDSQTWLCAADRYAEPLGKASGTLLSPDGAALALQGDEGLEIVSLEDGRRLKVSGDEPSLQGARWSPDSQTLAYLDLGAPMLARLDGTSIAINVELPPPSATYAAQSVEWAPDGSKLAFVTRGLGILASPIDGTAGVFSKSMLGSFASPWPLSFSADSRMLAGLDTIDGGQRGIVMIDTDTLELRETKAVDYYSFLGWTGDDQFAVVWSFDPEAALWLVPRDGEMALVSSTGGMPSPTDPEIALYGEGLHLVDPVSGSDRSLLSKKWSVQTLSWSHDGRAIGFDAGKQRGYVSADDGTQLLDALGVLSTDGWVASTDPDDPTLGMVTQNLWRPGGAHFKMRAAEPGAAGELVSRSSVRWFKGARLAYASDDGVHLAHADGSMDHVICPLQATLETPQGSAFEDRY